MPKQPAPEVIKWKDDVEASDFPAAFDYLSLRFGSIAAQKMVNALKEAPIVHRRANDILRACNREALPLHDPGVVSSLVKVAKHDLLSPILVVSFGDGADIADGYHRVSLAYDLDPFGTVPLRIANV